MEKHPNKPTRTHLHGICYVVVPKEKALKRFDIITNISKWANAKCGNSKFTWNNCDWESDTYATYWDYCLKEDPHYYYVINRYNDTNEQTRSAPLIETIQRRV